ncbi:MAG TPA: glycosyltransferase family 2 protein [Solirubrobacteraceae bacterium]|nr:glycosyltransferase family 2 protein [Solirubrobacteraceae bacterium]
MVLLEVIFWTTAAFIVWTHVGYPLFVSLLARVRSRPVRREGIEPTVTLVITAHDEQDSIEATVRGMLALDYPAARLSVLVASDGSSDRTDEIVLGLEAESGGRVSLLRCPRAGKVTAQDRAVRETGGEGASEIVAFSDANGSWEPGALRQLVANFADPDVAYACGNLRLRRSDGTNREGLYWRYELWLRENEARIGSITAGNGGIYAVRRSDYLESPDGRAGHDLGLVYRLVQRGRRAVSDPSAVAWETPARDLEDEYERKVRVSARCWQHVVSGRMLQGGGSLFLLQIVSHRLLRYESGLLHLLLLALAAVLTVFSGAHVLYGALLALQLVWLAMAVAGRLRLPVPAAGLAYYYFLVTWATVAGLWRYLRVGVPVTWDHAEGTRAV